MNKLDFVKLGANLVVGAGVSRITHQIIRNNTLPVSKLDKLTMAAGALALGGIAADASEKYTSARIDEAASSFGKIKNVLRSTGE